MTSTTELSGRQKEIMDIAQNMFREKGYMASSMRDIAKEAGMKAASLYNHFSSKDEILKTICFLIAGRFFAAIKRVNDRQQLLNPEQKLRLAIQEHILVIISNMDAAAVFLHEWRFLHPDNLQEFKRMRNNYEKEFENIILEGMVQGYFKSVDARFYCLTLFSALNWIYDWYKPQGHLSPQELSDRFSNLFLDGLKR